MEQPESWALALPGEPLAAQEALADYLEMGAAARSLRALAAAYQDRAARGEAVPTSSARTLADWSSSYRWRARADAYDDDQRRKRIAAEAAERVAMNKRHKQLAQAVHSKVLHWLKDPANQLERPADVIAALRISVDVERRAAGIPDALVQLSTMSDDELLARYAALVRRLSGRDEFDIIIEQQDDLTP